MLAQLSQLFEASAQCRLLLAAWPVPGSADCCLSCLLYGAFVERWWRHSRRRNWSASQAGRRDTKTQSCCIRLLSRWHLLAGWQWALASSRQLPSASCGCQQLPAPLRCCCPAHSPCWLTCRCASMCQKLLPGPAAAPTTCTSQSG